MDAAAIHLNINRKSFSKYWRNAGLPDTKSLPKVNQDPMKIYEIAIISDMHWGSNYQMMDEFDLFIEEVRLRGIQTLLCCGDSIEGLMKRAGAEKERFLHTTDDIMEYIEEHYPDGFKNNILINGNHCLSLDEKGDGFNFARNLCKARPDLKCVTNPSKMAEPIEIDGGAKAILFHGSGNCSQNLTVRTRNITERLLSSGVDFSFGFFGHCHSSSSDYYLGKWAFSCDCFQSMSPYLAQKMLVPRIGGLILKYGVNKEKEVCNVIAENVIYK